MRCRGARDLRERARERRAVGTIVAPELAEGRKELAIKSVELAEVANERWRDEACWSYRGRCPATVAVVVSGRVRGVRSSRSRSLRDHRPAGVGTA
jgi:hypothetical protein